MRKTILLQVWASLIFVFGFAVLSNVEVAAQSSPSDIFVNEEEDDTEEIFESLAGFSGMGFGVGGISFYGADVTKGAEIRPLLNGTFRYRFSDSWFGKADFGYGWNAFEARADTVLAVTYGTVGVQRQFRDVAGFDLRLGGGLGMYRWVYKNDGQTVLDPGTYQGYKGFDPGVVIGLDGERRMSRHMTIILSVDNHFMFTGDSKKFSENFDSNLGGFGFTFGLQYHFSPYEGILWERKQDNTIVMTSGKEGK